MLLKSVSKASRSKTRSDEVQRDHRSKLPDHVDPEFTRSDFKDFSQFVSLAAGRVRLGCTYVPGRVEPDIIR